MVSLLVLGMGCRNPEEVSATERRAISDSLQALVIGAHDFSKPEVLRRLIALYPDSGRVISVAAGRIVTAKPALEAEITSFWQRVGQNMQGPKFEMGSVYVDVLTRNAAVMTFNYRIPHMTPAGRPHTVAGAWTALWRLQQGRWMIVQEHLSDAPEVTTAAIVPDSAPPPAAGHNMSDHVMPGGSKK
ncbi:MAG: nuclear transport factor 2 family protein [Phycisphaerae bacterium]|nr:nuclear transport factor 2 family protein [Gemmatimonadaceae bacterium]